MTPNIYFSLNVNQKCIFKGEEQFSKQEHLMMNHNSELLSVDVVKFSCTYVGVSLEENITDAVNLGLVQLCEGYEHCLDDFRYFIRKNISLSLCIYNTINKLIWTRNIYFMAYKNEEEMLVGDKIFTNFPLLTLNDSGYSVTINYISFGEAIVLDGAKSQTVKFNGTTLLYLQRFLWTFVRVKKRVKENNIIHSHFACHTGSFQIKRYQNKSNKDSKLTLEGNSFLLQDLGIFTTINQSVIRSNFCLFRWILSLTQDPNFLKSFVVPSIKVIIISLETWQESNVVPLPFTVWPLA